MLAPGESFADLRLIRLRARRAQIDEWRAILFALEFLAKVWDRKSQSLSQSDRGLPIEKLPREVDIWTSHARIITGQGHRAYLNRPIQKFGDDTGEFQNTILCWIAHIDRLVVGHAHHAHNSLDKVVDILVAAGLPAVTMDGQDLPSQNLADKV